MAGAAGARGDPIAANQSSNAPGEDAYPRRWSPQDIKDQHKQKKAFRAAHRRIEELANAPSQPEPPAPAPDASELVPPPRPARAPRRVSFTPGTFEPRSSRPIRSRANTIAVGAELGTVMEVSPTSEANNDGPPGSHEPTPEEQPAPPPSQSDTRLLDRRDRTTPEPHTPSGSALNPTVGISRLEQGIDGRLGKHGQHARPMGQIAIIDPLSRDSYGHNLSAIQGSKIRSSSDFQPGPIMPEPMVGPGPSTKTDAEPSRGKRSRTSDTAVERRNSLRSSKGKGRETEVQAESSRQGMQRWQVGSMPSTTQQEPQQEQEPHEVAQYAPPVTEAFELRAAEDRSPVDTRMSNDGEAGPGPGPGPPTIDWNELLMLDPTPPAIGGGSMSDHPMQQALQQPIAGPSMSNADYGGVQQLPGAAVNMHDPNQQLPQQPPPNMAFANPQPAPFSAPPALAANSLAQAGMPGTNMNFAPHDHPPRSAPADLATGTHPNNYFDPNTQYGALPDPPPTAPPAHGTDHRYTGSFNPNWGPVRQAPPPAPPAAGPVPYTSHMAGSASDINYGFAHQLSDQPAAYALNQEAPMAPISDHGLSHNSASAIATQARLSPQNMQNAIRPAHNVQDGSGQHGLPHGPPGAGARPAVPLPWQQPIVPQQPIAPTQANPIDQVSASSSHAERAAAAAAASQNWTNNMSPNRFRSPPLQQRPNMQRASSSRQRVASMDVTGPRESLAGPQRRERAHTSAGSMGSRNDPLAEWRPRGGFGYNGYPKRATTSGSGRQSSSQQQRAQQQRPVLPARNSQQSMQQPPIQQQPIQNQAMSGPIVQNQRMQDHLIQSAPVQHQATMPNQPFQNQMTPQQIQYTPNQPQQNQPQVTPIQPHFTPNQPQMTPIENQFTPNHPMPNLPMQSTNMPQPQLEDVTYMNPHMQPQQAYQANMPPGSDAFGFHQPQGVQQPGVPPANYQQGAQPHGTGPATYQPAAQPQDANMANFQQPVQQQDVAAVNYLHQMVNQQQHQLAQQQQQPMQHDVYPQQMYNQQPHQVQMYQNDQGPQMQPQMYNNTQMQQMQPPVYNNDQAQPPQQAPQMYQHNRAQQAQPQMYNNDQHGQPQPQMYNNEPMQQEPPHGYNNVQMPQPQPQQPQQAYHNFQPYDPEVMVANVIDWAFIEGRNAQQGPN